MTIESERDSIAKLGATIDELLTVIPFDEEELHGQLVAVKTNAAHEGGNSTYYWKRALQVFGSRVLEIRETVDEDKRPEWIKTARGIIDKARS